MRVFIVEDDPVRHKVFKERYKDHDLIIADGYWPAIKMVQELESFDLFCLDHDLMLSGHSGTDAKTEKTGYHFVQYFVAHVPKEKWPKQVIVHSWNPPGAANMIQLLTHYDINCEWQMFYFK